jgi:hypothetical protein
METRRQEDKETRREGDMETQGHGGMEAWRHGDMDMETSNGKRKPRQFSVIHLMFSHVKTVVFCLSVC